MAYNNIEAALTAQQIQAIKDAIKTINDTMPFLITLTAEERQSIFKLGAKSVDFVNDCNTVANNYPQIFPAGFKINELNEDSLLFEQLSEIKMLLDSLNEKVNDTTMAVGNEAMKSSLMVYEYVKTAVKTEPGLKSVSEQLQQRFKKPQKLKPL